MKNRLKKVIAFAALSLAGVSLGLIVFAELSSRDMKIAILVVVSMTLAFVSMSLPQRAKQEPEQI